MTWCLADCCWSAGSPSSPPVREPYTMKEGEGWRTQNNPLPRFRLVALGGRLSVRYGRPCGVGTVGPSSVPWSDGDGWVPGRAAGVGLEESGRAWGSGLPLQQGLSLGAMEVCAAVRRCFREGLFLPGVALWWSGWPGCTHGWSGGVVALPREVPDVEAPREGALLQAEQARVGDLVEGAISEYLHQGLVVGDDDQVVPMTGTVSQRGSCASRRGSSRGGLRSSHSAAEAGNNRCRVGTSRGEGKCVFGCRKFRRPGGWLGRLLPLPLGRRPPAGVSTRMGSGCSGTASRLPCYHAAVRS